MSEKVVIAGFDFTDCENYVLSCDKPLAERGIPKKRLEFLCHVRFAKNPTENLRRVVLKCREKTE